MFRSLFNIERGACLKHTLREGRVFETHTERGCLFQTHTMNGVIQIHTRRVFQARTLRVGCVCFKHTLREGRVFQTHTEKGVCVFEAHTKREGCFKHRLRGGVFRTHTERGVCLK